MFDDKLKYLLIFSIAMILLSSLVYFQNEATGYNVLGDIFKIFTGKPTVSCTVGYKCYSAKVLGYQNPKCKWSKLQTCQYGCLNNACYFNTTCQDIYSCSGNTLVHQLTDCSNVTQNCPFGCANNACKSDPCAGVSCPDVCQDANNLNTNGQCAGGSCQYTPISCAYGCNTTANNKCNLAPPAPQCIADTQCGSFSCNGSSLVTPKCIGGVCTTQSSVCAYGCSNGACKTDACAGISCPNICQGSTTLKFNGQCVAGVCQYSNQSCSYGCASGACNLAPLTANNVWCEAERSSLTSPMTSGQDSLASNGIYIYSTATDSVHVPPVGTGTGQFTVNISAAGTYILWTRVYGPDINSNSHYTQIDNGQPIVTNNENIFAAWRWTNVINGSTTPIQINFATSGTHTIKIYGREANERIDKLLLTTNSSYIPSGLGDADNCLGICTSPAQCGATICAGSTLSTPTCTGGSCGSSTTACTYGCNTTTNNKCNQAPAAPSNSCSDTDGGNVPSIAGTVSGYLNSVSYSYADICAGSTLTEYYCSGTNYLSTPVSCANGCSSGACNSAPGTVNVVADFSRAIRTVSPLAIGMDESGYGGSVLPTDALQRQKLQTLKLGYMRMALKYTTTCDSTSAIICGGAGCATGVAGDAWINSIKAIGAEPVIQVPMMVTCNVQDAANLVKHYNIDTNNKVTYWILGNEPTISSASYSDNFNRMYDAMKAVDPTIKIGGPANAFWDPTFIQNFLTLSGSKTDFVDYHAYGQGGTVTKADDVLMNDAGTYEIRIGQIRTMLASTVPSRVSQIGIEIGEWNLDWDGDPKTYTQYNTVWSASALGHILRAGGISLAYADKNGGLGALYENADSSHGAQKDDPMPLYHGYGMFTGEGLFTSLGSTVVYANTTASNLEAYAFSNPKSIIVINKEPSTSYTATVTLSGITSGSMDVWRKDTSMNAISPPAKIGTLTYTGSAFTYSFPPYSVTTFVIS